MAFRNSKKKYISKSGVGLKKLKIMYDKVGLNYNKKTVLLKSRQKKEMNTLSNKFSYAGTIKLKNKRAISFYIKLKNYRGIRHMLKYPTRGQRTHTNAKTVKKRK